MPAANYSHIEAGSDGSDSELMGRPMNAPREKSWGLRSPLALATFVAGMCAAATLTSVGHGSASSSAPSSSPAMLGQLRELHESMSQATSRGLMAWHELPKELSSECKQAFREHALKMQKKAMALLGEAMDACMAGEKSDVCKMATEQGKHLEEHVEKDCKKEGYLCKITSTDKEGEEEEEECVPKPCHQELEKIEAAMKKDMEHEEDEDVPECKDFDCKVEIECPAN